MEIRFPAAFPFSPFRVVRSGVGVVDVLSESDVMQSVCRIVEENIGADSKKVQELTLGLKKDFSNIYQDFMGMWAKYVDFFEDQLYWLAYKVDDSSESIALDILDPIVAANKEVVSGVVQMYRWIVKLPVDITGYTEDKQNHLLKLAAVLDESIQRSIK